MQDDQQPGKEHVPLTCDTEKEGAFEEAKRRQLAAVDGLKSKNPTTVLHIDKSSYTFTCKVKCFANIAQNSVPKFMSWSRLFHFHCWLLLMDIGF